MNTQFQRTALNRHAVAVVLQFLKDSGYESSFRALEAESDVSLEEENLCEGGILFTALDLYDSYQASNQPVDSAEDKQTEELLLRRGDESQLVRDLHKNFDAVHKSNVLSVRFAPWQDRTVVASGAVDKSVKLTDVATGEVVYTIASQCPSAVLSMDFNPIHPELLLVSCMDGSILIFDTSANEAQCLLQHIHKHRKYVVCVRWAPDGRIFTAASYDHSLSFWGPTSGAGEGRPSEWQFLHDILYTGSVESIEFLKNSNLLAASVRDDNYLHLVDINTQQEAAKVNFNINLDDHVSFTVLNMASSQDGSFLLTSTDKHRTMIYRTGQSKIVRNFYGASNDEYSNPRSVWALDERYVYSTSQDRSIVAWEVATQRVVHKLVSHTANVRDLHHHPTRPMLASCGFDKVIKIWTPTL
eukprot:TRINITY_DN9165_c0_g1_i6.p1 TRINITY_DN9165_c0_g1~~TRINITY_DN9165_c0_g1_i6.p1  ORF type:complete len:414 (+),score=93.43 TRINITY_DN9165_c0_g1_i6:80-1321(+)